MRFFSLSFLLFVSLYSGSLHAQAFKWPGITNETKPWTRWWWMGSAVNQPELTTLLTEYSKAGLGGVEITPIYGVKGYENKFINYLSPAWMEMLKYTVEEARRLGIGVDMAQTSGWPFGGPWVKSEDACKYLTYVSYNLSAGETVKGPIVFVQTPVLTGLGKMPDIKQLKDPISANSNLHDLGLEQVRFKKEIPLQALMAFSNDGEVLNLTKNVDDKNRLNWVAPKGKWVLYALFQGWHGKLVERAGPGGAGDVIDHFSAQATNNYLKHFDNAFLGKDISGIRAFFNDSYEVDDAKGQADWTPEILAEFRKRRGYDLLNFLPALLKREVTDESKRVRSDYRETISELLLEKFSKVWHSWAQNKGKIIRNQAHGSPGNLLDLYSVSDIPETEGNNILNFKMASSAGNVSGKKLISSETATWENEHFSSNLAGIKKTIDRFFLGGVNHIFYHGTNYSPPKETWPGWHFYASVELNPSNSLWDHFPVLNNYVTRVQSFLQKGQSNNDILVYYPIYDSFSDIGEEMLLNFHDIKREFPNSSFAANSEYIWNKGYGFDFISDRQILDLSASDKSLRAKATTYKTLVFFEPKYMPLPTLKHVVELARNGATIIFLKSLPSDVPGLSNLEERRKEFKSVLTKLNFISNGSGIKKASVGTGEIIVSDRIDDALESKGVGREQMFDMKLQSLRKKSIDGYYYFITNTSNEKVKGWIPLTVDLKSAAIFNPMTNESGLAKIRIDTGGKKSVYLHLDPGESYVVQTFDKLIAGTGYPYFELAGRPLDIEGAWTIEFTKGGPVLPMKIVSDTLKSWTEFPGDEVKNFSGSANYSISFLRPKGEALEWLLDLGKVNESARIFLNGKEIATQIGPIFQTSIPASEFKDINKLEIRVSNLMINRIADMDRRKINWRKFYNINFISLLPENRNSSGQSDFSKKAAVSSGLIGPVTLTAIKQVGVK